MSDTGSSQNGMEKGVAGASGKEYYDATGKNKAPFFVKPGRGFWRREGQSLKRWWWVHLIIIAAVTLLITLPIVYVGFPNISQQGVDNTKVSVEGIGLSNPTQDSYDFSLNTTQRPQTFYTPTLDPFEVSFYLTDYDMDTPFQVAQFPRTHVQKPTTVNITNQRVMIQNRPQWDQYLRVAFASKTYRVTNTGKTNLHLGKLPTTSVNYKKTITLPGLNGLPNVDTHDISINPSTQTNNFHAMVTIPNPSTSTITLGNLTYANYIAPNDTYIGRTSINNVILYPGNNTFPLVASNAQQPVIAALGVRPYCQTGMIDLTIVPLNATVGGVEIPYFLQSLTNITQSLPIGQAISKAAGGLVGYYCPDDQ